MRAAKKNREKTNGKRDSACKTKRLKLLRASTLGATTTLVGRRLSSTEATNLSRYSCLIGTPKKTLRLILIHCMHRNMTLRYCSVKVTWEESIRMNSRKFMKPRMER